MKWKLSTSRHNVSSWRELWSGEWSQHWVERPESMSWAPSEAKPTVSTVLIGGEISSPLLGTEGPSWRGAPEEARREGILYMGTILCPATAGQWEVVEPGHGELSTGLPGVEQSGEMHTDEASGWILHSPSLSPCLDRMSAPILWTPGM